MAKGYLQWNKLFIKLFILSGVGISRKEQGTIQKLCNTKYEKCEFSDKKNYLSIVSQLRITMRKMGSLDKENHLSVVH